MINFQKALQDSALVFKRPEEISRKKELSRQQKIKLLRQWEYDVREIQVAEEENMDGPPAATLASIHEALNSLGVFHDSERSAPTKQGGGIWLEK
ncbi:MAG TPA: hypothetical protein VLX11_09380 [Candidatus Acidoferrales bacterium]|nr:hypothetical protein [Candidatus Acidoferrales bacterium]